MKQTAQLPSKLPSSRCCARRKATPREMAWSSGKAAPKRAFALTSACTHALVHSTKEVSTMMSPNTCDGLSASSQVPPRCFS